MDKVSLARMETRCKRNKYSETGAAREEIGPARDPSPARLVLRTAADHSANHRLPKE